MNEPKTFEVELNGQVVWVSDHTIKSARVFHITYPNRKSASNPQEFPELTPIDMSYLDTTETLFIRLLEFINPLV